MTNSRPINNPILLGYQPAGVNAPRGVRAVNAGVAYVGNVGGAVVDFTALGDPVNVASRLQRCADAGQLLVGAGVDDELLAGYPSRTFPVRGREAPVDAFVLTPEGVGMNLAA